MARLTLKDDGYTFKKIFQGRKWIGRVWKNAEGQYVGKIGKTESKPQPTERAAFEAVGAAYFGYASADALHQHNSQVRFKKREARARVDHAMSQLQRGDFSAFENLLNGMFKREG